MIHWGRWGEIERERRKGTTFTQYETEKSDKSEQTSSEEK